MKAIFRLSLRNIFSFLLGHSCTREKKDEQRGGGVGGQGGDNVKRKWSSQDPAVFSNGLCHMSLCQCIVKINWFCYSKLNEDAIPS